MLENILKNIKIPVKWLVPFYAWDVYRDVFALGFATILVAIACFNIDKIVSVLERWHKRIKIKKLAKKHPDLATQLLEQLPKKRTKRERERDELKQLIEELNRMDED